MGHFDLFGWWCAWLDSLRAANGPTWWRGPLLWGVVAVTITLLLDAWGGSLAPLAVITLFVAGALWLIVFFRVATKGPNTLFVFVAGAFFCVILLRILNRLIQLMGG